MKRTTFTRLARSLTVGLLIVPVAAAQPGPAAGAAGWDRRRRLSPCRRIRRPTSAPRRCPSRAGTSPTSRSGATRVRPVSRYVVRT